MTMRRIWYRALAAQVILLALLRFTNAHDTTTTTTTTSTSTVTTSTTTVTTHQQKEAFLTTATLEIKSGTTVIMGGPSHHTATPSGGNGNSEYTGAALQSAVLNSTNLFRKQHEAPPVTWDDGLAKYAQNYAEKCIWEHSGGPHGENLAEGFATPTLAIDYWAAEQEKYNYGAAHFTESTGHFTQLVWKNTRKVGCGAVNCSSDASGTAKGWYLVCEYSPPGNVEGRFQSNVLEGKGSGSSCGNSKGCIGNAAPSQVSGLSRWLVALVAASSMAAACL